MLCIIPSRKDSKRVPGKNRKLIQHTFDIAKKCFKDILNVHDIVVTTNDEEILMMAYKQGIPWIVRPDDLCTDSSPEFVFVEHALDTLGITTREYCVLYPTVPFRKFTTVMDILDQWNTNKDKFNSLRTIKKVSEHPNKMFRPEKQEDSGTINCIVPYNNVYYSSDNPGEPTQFYQDVYVQIPYLYIGKVGGTTYEQPIYPYLLEGKETIDVNTPLDMLLVEKILEGNLA